MNFIIKLCQNIWEVINKLAGYSTLQQCEVWNYHTPLHASIQHSMLALDSNGSAWSKMLKLHLWLADSVGN